MRRSLSSPAEFFAVVENMPPGPTRESQFGQCFSIDDELLFGCGVEPGCGLVQGLDHIELHEHAAEFADDLPLFGEGRLLFRGRLVHVLGRLCSYRGFEMIRVLL